jgi:hypothetical protein
MGLLALLLLVLVSNSNINYINAFERTAACMLHAFAIVQAGCNPAG